MTRGLQRISVSVEIWILAELYSINYSSGYLWIVVLRSASYEKKKTI